MITKEDQLTKEAVVGVIFGFVVGVLASFLGNSTNFSILIIPFFMIVGLLVISAVQFYRLNKNKPSRVTKAKSFHWGVELNLKKLQINYDKSAAMLQFAGILAGGAFVSMIFIIRDYPLWNLGHQIFFPLAAILFIIFMHLSFRWWFIIRSSAEYLKLYNEKGD